MTKRPHSIWLLDSENTNLRYVSCLTELTPTDIYNADEQDGTYCDARIEPDSARRC